MCICWYNNNNNNIIIIIINIYDCVFLWRCVSYLLQLNSFTCTFFFGSSGCYQGAQFLLCVVALCLGYSARVESEYLTSAGQSGMLQRESCVLIRPRGAANVKNTVRSEKIGPAVLPFGFALVAEIA